MNGLTPSAPDIPMVPRAKTGRNYRRLISTLVAAILLAGLARVIWSGVKQLEDLPVHHPPERQASSGFLHFSAGSIDRAKQQLLDGNGVLLHDYGQTLGQQYNPLFIADFVLSLVPLWSEVEARRMLMANLDHLLAGAVNTREGHLLFPYRFDFPVMRETAPWHSAMAQARIGQAMMWGWRLTGDGRYLQAGRGAILAMDEPGIDPPVKQALEQGVWLAEFPGGQFQVLDGTLVAIVGVHQVLLGLPADDPDHPRIRTLFDQAMRGFKHSQSCFTTPFGGVYFSDQAHELTQAYYDIIVSQLSYLADFDADIDAIARHYALDDGFTRLGYAIWQRQVYKLHRRGILKPCVHAS